MHNEAWFISRIALLGDRKAFSQLVEVYQSPIRRFFLNLTGGDEELSKDLSQDTFVKAWLSIGSFRAAAKFSTWLYRIAYNIFYDYYRAKKPTAEINVEIVSDRIADNTSDKDFSMDFVQALTVLKEDERTAMLLFYMEDQTIDKISKIMNCPVGTVKSHLHRGKEKLSGYLKSYKI
ncbi:MAG: sigma-70 family RNA polymerase sigma factor [Dysgonamonadaceae bacterium]|jgi:RNA polymerase sigma-70 factor (ECF subfamily)|nr:sigma-70 family RNA polymerase sigma factor [Dysgonamonadaceae bacterium]